MSCNILRSVGYVDGCMLYVDLEFQHKFQTVLCSAVTIICYIPLQAAKSSKKLKDHKLFTQFCDLDILLWFPVR